SMMKRGKRYIVASIKMVKSTGLKNI
ncbi:uncharacterized protein METZ01_LOCUS446358, partial [marine metagenome]